MKKLLILAFALAALPLCAQEETPAKPLSPAEKINSGERGYMLETDILTYALTRSAEHRVDMMCAFDLLLADKPSKAIASVAENLRLIGKTNQNGKYFFLLGADPVVAQRLFIAEGDSACALILRGLDDEVVENPGPFLERNLKDLSPRYEYALTEDGLLLPGERMYLTAAPLPVGIQENDRIKITGDADAVEAVFIRQLKIAGQEKSVIITDAPSLRKLFFLEKSGRKLETVKI